MTRRNFSAALVGMTAKAGRRIEGSFVNDAFQLGHKLRDHAAFPAPKQQKKIPVVIVGGGIAGLSAGWWLDKHGFRDFVLLEMEGQAGGNSRWGENAISRFPWGAHYVPVPAKGESLTRELFEELGVYREGRWDERVLCFAPQERLFIHDHWQDGLEPEFGVSRKDRDEYKAFNARIQDFRATGQFTIPMERGVRRGPEPVALDHLSMAEWMRQAGFNSRYLNWYVDYACRDDYGALARDTSAWAGIHYFCAREPEDKGPLTWPEGNGFIARKLIEKLGRYIKTGAPVYRISNGRVFTPETEYVAEHIIFAAPTFLAHYLIEGAPPAPGFEYSPWLTANLTLDRLPESAGEVAWDNVIFDSPTLGYVDATHMSLATRQERSVWTFYWSLAEHPPARARKLLLERDWGFWRDAILRDLGRAHPDLTNCVSRIDMMRFGHAMVRPSPGFLFSDERLRWQKPVGNIWFANSDLSGFSIFEEAQHRGVQAAKKIFQFHAKL